MFTQDECERRLNSAYPEVYRVAMRNSWWHPVSTLRIWVSFEESGYDKHLQGLENALTQLQTTLSARDYHRLCDGLFDWANFWGHVNELCTAQWLLSRDIEIVEVERQYGAKKPDFTVAYEGDEGVIECKALQPTATTRLQISPGDALVYLMRSITDLPYCISFDTLPSDENGVYAMVSDLLDWLGSPEIRTMGVDARRKILPSGYGVKVSRGAGWTTFGSHGALHATMIEQQKFLSELSSKRRQVQRHAGYNCILVDTSFFPAFILPPAVKQLTDQWFSGVDANVVVDAVLIAGVNVPTGTLMPSPTIWPNPQSQTLNKVHGRLADRPTITWERFVRWEF